MPTVFIKDTLRASVEAATGGKVTVLYDDKGYPSYMFVLPKFNIQDIDASLGSGVFPAFVVGGIEKNEIFIGQYAANVKDGRAVSLPGLDPATNISFDQARAYCKNKGSGWHMMTNWEWAAIIHWMLKNGYQPRGNTSYGKSHVAAYETGVRVDGKAPGEGGNARVLTGSGPASWRHDKTHTGISDLVGNVWEWTDGMKLTDGKIYMPADNNYSLDEANWNDTGACIDSTVATSGQDGIYENIGDPLISDTVTNRTGPAGDNGDYDYISIQYWRGMTSKPGYTVPNIIKQACIMPYDTENPEGGIVVRNNGERMPLRGSLWASSDDSGPSALNLDAVRSRIYADIGFRLAFIG